MSRTTAGRLQTARRRVGAHAKFLAQSAHPVEQLALYVDPDHQGRGVGRALLEDVKRRRPDGLRLHVFTRNAPARRFYDAAGFVIVEQSDGHGNEEQEPDCTYAWTPNST